MSDADEVLKEFLVECAELLDKLDRDLVSLERNPTDKELLAGIFRCVHTIKGSCGFLGFSKMQALAHAGENLLGRLRNRELTLNREIAGGLLALVDAVRKILRNIEATRSDAAGDYGALIERLNRLSAGGEATTAPVPSGKPDPFDPAQGKPPEPAADRAADATATAISDKNIRVDVGLLDKLMNVVGELVLVRNRILQLTANQRDSGMAGTSQRLNMITTELQEGIMKARMRPIGDLWGRFPRLVRDLSVASGKEIRLEMEGEGTELDKSIIEALNEPLLHLVRNGVDHGIETPAARAAFGKPPEGCIRLRAFHEAGQVVVEVSDDGAGIEAAKVGQKAVQLGLVTPEELAGMDERDTVNLIFRRGFSTAEKVTSLSGRGVGMDVVKVNVERLGGTIDIQSRPGLGTKIRMKIPLTLAIIPALIVNSNGTRYAIPSVSLQELVRLEGEQAATGIETIHSVPVYRLRGSLLPLVHLNRILQTEGGPAPAAGVVNIVVLQAGYRPFGLVVDAVNDTQEIVVKALGKHLKGIPVFGGATILGDGTVALILDVVGLAQHASVIAEVRDAAPRAKSAVPESVDRRKAFLIVRGPDDGRLAMPMASVTRLEELPATSLEAVGDQDVVQYRGGILPLIRVSRILHERRRKPRRPETAAEAAARETLTVVVCTRGRNSVGLVVDGIVDIVEEALTAERPSTRKGVVGTAVLRSRVTEILDVEGIIREHDPTFYQGDG